VRDNISSVCKATEMSRQRDDRVIELAGGAVKFTVTFSAQRANTLDASCEGGVVSRTNGHIHVADLIDGHCLNDAGRPAATSVHSFYRRRFRGAPILLLTSRL
jgi:hypothetical protein